MFNSDVRTVSKNISELMGDMSVKDLSDKSGIPYSTLVPIIKGERDFGISKLICIAKALDISIEALFSGTHTLTAQYSSPIVKKPNIKYLTAFLTNNTSTRCAILNLVTNEQSISLFPFPIFCANNQHNTIDTLKSCIKKQLAKEDALDFSEIAAYSSAISYEHVIGREKLDREGRRNFGLYLLEPDWMPTFHALYPDQNGILITINDGIAIAYSNDNGKTVGKHQGYTFPISDEAGGIWLGCQALRHAINVAEGIEDRSMLSDRVLSVFNSDLNLLSTKVFDNPRDTYIEMSNIVRSLAHRKQKSYSLIKQSFENIWTHIEALDKKLGLKLPIKLSGDLSDIYEEFIPVERFQGSNYRKETDEISYAFKILKDRIF